LIDGVLVLVLVDGVLVLLEVDGLISGTLIFVELFVLLVLGMTMTPTFEGLLPEG